MLKCYVCVHYEQTSRALFETLTVPTWRTQSPLECRIQYRNEEQEESLGTKQVKTRFPL